MKKILPLTASLSAVSALAGGAGLPAGGSPAQASPTFRTVACPTEIKASQCGYVRVPLDHAQPQGPQIELFVAVKKAAAPAAQRAADPLFYLEGGPGAPSSPAAGQLAQVFPNRDVVGIDQRGIGRSLPSLGCPQVTELMNRKDLKTTELSPLFSKALTDCGAALREKGVKLEFFNTGQAALDVEAVRRALGYRQINLYGASYGTRLAQEVMRRAPDSLRAVVLDSVIPPSVDRVARSAASIQEASERVFKACAADADCNRKYPDLKNTYRAVLKQLNAKPLPVQFKGTAGELDAPGFQSLLVGAMYFEPGLQEFPGMIVAARDGKIDVLKNSFAVKFGEAAADTLTWQAFFTNECRGEVAYSTPDRLQAGLNAAPEFAKALGMAPGISSAEIFKVCQGLNLTAPAPHENEPVTSSVPVLLLAGEFDPVTPPAWLPEAAQNMKNNQQVVISGAAHGSGLSSQCGYQTVMGFLTDPTKKVNTACAAQGKLTFK